MSTPVTLSETNVELRAPAKGAPLWLRVDALLDGESSAPLRNAHLVFDDEIILHVGEESPPRELLRPGQDSPDAILPGFTALPGLIESHAHLFLEGGELDFEKRKVYLAQSPEELLRKAERRLEPLLRLGVVGVRDAGDKRGVGLALSRRCREADRPLMPYVDSPGAAIHREGRYGSFMARPLEEFDSLEACVAARVDAGADRIKLIPTGIINFKAGKVTAKPQMTSEEVMGLVNAARKHKRQTFAHATGDDGIEAAIDGGVNSIEHGFFIRPDQLARLRDRKIAWVQTFAPVQEQVDHADVMGWDEAIVSNLQRILDDHASSLCKGREMGVEIIAGSDAGSCGVAHGLGFLYELRLMEKAGLPPISVVNAATGTPARLLGFRDKFGLLRKGWRARLILTSHDPLKTVANLEREKLVFFDGRMLRSDENFDPSGL